MKKVYSILPLLILSISILATAGSVTARVTNASGSPLNQAEVCLTASDGSVQKQITGSSGVVTFSNVHSGDIQILGQAQGFNPKTLNVVLATTADVFVPLSKGSNPLQLCSIKPARDLTISIQGDQLVSVGSRTQFTVTLTNSQSTPVSNVVARVAFPTNFSVGGNFTSQPGFTDCVHPLPLGSTNEVKCTAVSLGGTPQSFNVQGSFDDSGSTSQETVTVAATVDPTNAIAEGTETNNTSNLSVNVRSHADLNWDLSGSDLQPVVGQDYAYLIKLKNTGSLAATSVVGTLTLPLDSTFVRFENNTFDTCTSIGSNQFKCQSSSINKNAEDSVRLVAHLKDGVSSGKQLTFSANADRDGTEVHIVDNTSQVVSTAKVVAIDLQVTDITADVTRDVASIFMYFRVTVRNSGSSKSGSFRLKVNMLPEFADQASNCPAPSYGAFQIGAVSTTPPAPIRACLSPEPGESGAGANPVTISSLNSSEQTPKLVFSAFFSDDNLLATRIVRITACADSDKQIAETDETNNCKFVDISI